MDQDLKAPEGKQPLTLADQVTLAVIKFQVDGLEKYVEKSFAQINNKLDSFGTNFVSVAAYNELDRRVKKLEAIFDWVWKGVGLILLGAFFALILKGNIPGR